MSLDAPMLFSSSAESLFWKVTVDGDLTRGNSVFLGQEQIEWGELVGVNLWLIF